MPEIHLISKKKLTQTTLPVTEFIFTRPENWHYHAGQFVALDFPTDSSPIRRFYSLASHPSEDKLKFIIKIIPEGLASERLLNLNPDSKLILSGPLGHFIVPTGDDPIYFFVTGTGIAPVLGILKDITFQQPARKVKIYWGLKNESHAFYLNELNLYKKLLRNFEYQISFSAGKNQNERITTTFKREQEIITQELRNNNFQTNFMLVGNPEMVKDLKQLLTEISVPAQKIKFELFTPAFIKASK